MPRKIFLIAREFVHPAAELDPQTSRFVETQRELHADVREELETYGNVAKQRTSGVFARVQTPPHGIRIDEEHRKVLADPMTHPSTLRAVESRKKEVPEFFTNLFTQIKICDCVVIIRDGQNDLRGAVAMYVHLHDIPMLALQLEPKGLQLPGDPLYELPNITNIRFQTFEQAKPGIRRFMNGIPMRAAAG
jgi:hypothetical protein